MMRFLLVILLFSQSLAAQSIFGPQNDSAFVKFINDLPVKEPFDTAHRYKKVKEHYIYLVSDKDMHDYFGYDIVAGYRHFDFATYHILGELRCRQCDQHCDHTVTRACHRNACKKGWVWVMRENKKAFSPVKLEEFLFLKKERSSRLNDTILNRQAGDTAVWYTSGHGDCFAKFRHSLFRDNHYPVLLLKQFNYYGGCRAGGSWDFELPFIMPPGIVYHSKRIILMEGKLADK